MNDLSRKDLGKYGESVACTYLVGKGYFIIARNLRLSLGSSRGEIDILAIKDRSLYIFEVKTSASFVGKVSYPELRLSKSKIDTLRRLRSILLYKFHHMQDLDENNPIFNIRSSVYAYLKRLNYSSFRTVVWGIAIDVQIDSRRGVCLREQVIGIKVRTFPNL